MAWGKSNEQWNHTASLMATLASIHADPDKGTPPTMATYHPFLEEPEPPPAPAGLLESLGFKKVKPEGSNG